MHEPYHSSMNTRILRIMFLAATMVLFQVAVHAQSFQQFIDRLNSLPLNERQAVVDSFMSAGHSFPYCENDTTVHFIFKGDAISIALAGDATGWNPNILFAQISGTDFWYHTAIYEPDARLDYQFIRSAATWILDPLNPYTCNGGYGPNSELRMPQYVFPVETAYYDSLPHGALKDTVFYSENLGNSRTIRIYLPVAFTPSGRQFPVVLFHDGPDYVSLCNAKNVLDYLISQKMMAPVIAVFVPPVDREAEYAGEKQENFRKFICEELMPFLLQRYPIDPDPQKHAVIGASNGGNISLYLGWKNPEIFGKVAAQSSNVQSAISEGLASGDKLDLSFYLDIGTYDIGVLIPMVRNLRDILQEKGYFYQYLEVHEGHSWGNWKGHLKLPLMQFFPWPAGYLEYEADPPVRLYQNYPNPFRSETTIPFFLQHPEKVSITVSDAGGKTLRCIPETEFQAGEHQVSFSSTGFPAGHYDYTLRTRNSSASKTMTIIE